jgi:predicted Zn-dependent protease
LAETLRFPFAMALLAQGDILSAERVLAPLAEAKTDEQTAQVVKAVQRRAGLVKGSMQKAASLVQQDRGSADALKLRGQAMLEQGWVVQAGYLLDEVRRRGESDFATWLLSGVVRARMDGAASFLAEWPEPPAKPGQVKSAWLELARACAQYGSVESALPYLESPAAEQELDVPVLVAMGDVALGARRVALAMDYYRRATEQQPDEPAAWLRLSDLAAQMNDLDAARGHLREAQEAGAPEGELKPRREKFGMPEPGERVRTVIR